MCTMIVRLIKMVSEKLPREKWFERLVNYCFRSYISGLLADRGGIDVIREAL